MSDLPKLGFDTPPWEEPPALTDKDAPPLARYASNGCRQDSVVPSQSRADLEIYRKADNFKRLKLLSGSTIGEPVKQYVRKHYGQEGITRLTLVKFAMDVLNYIPSDDVLLALSCTNKARCIIATAGAGKTTSLQVDLLISKMMDTELHCYGLKSIEVSGTGVSLPSILYLNYNKHNVQPCVDKHRSICAKLNSALTDSISDDIDSTTVHAFCYRWLNAFSGKVNLPELKIASDTDRKTIWGAVMRPRWKKFYEDTEVGVEWQTMDELYTYKVESMLEWEEFFQCAKFIDTGLKSEFVKSCITKYDSMKRSMGLLDFTDYVMLTIETLREHPDLQEQIQERYKIIVADENQDFTAMMNELLLLLYNPKRNRLIVVGDSDQTIYEFKGVSPDNVVRLVDRLEDVALLGLGTNYRCPDHIVDAAKNILAMNIMRFDKPINTVRTGGEILRHPVEDDETQCTEVLETVQRIGKEGWGSTVITYRNNRSSLIIGEELYYAGIPFSVIDDQRPFNNLVFKHINEGLRALREKDNMELNKHLYRFLPVSREHWEKIIEANYRRRHVHLHDLVLPNEMPRGTQEAMNTLVGISLLIDDSPCSDFVQLLFGLYRKYFYDFIRKSPESGLGNESYQELLVERALKFWSRSYTYDYMCAELRDRNVDRQDAVTLSTFHGLKGLEFDYVIAVDFNDSVFPNFYGIEQKYPENTAMETKEAENRLCYVLVTRTIKELHLFYRQSDPSIYLDRICPISRDTGPSNPGETALKRLDLSAVSMPADNASARMSFINRLTVDRGK